jgi:hypothetical protein
MFVYFGAVRDENESLIESFSFEIAPVSLPF